MPARHFQRCSLPIVPEQAVLCVGIILDDPAAWAEVCAPLASERERRQAHRFTREIDAARHLAGRALVRRVLRGTFGFGVAANFALTPYGKPFCPDAPAHFSISHSGGMVWAAFCRAGAVGIDVEEVRPLPDAADLAGQLHPQECAELRALPPAELQAAFYRCWARKEAVLKAAGLGLSLPLGAFRVRTCGPDNSWIVSFPRVSAFLNGEAVAASDPAETWTSRDIPAGSGYRCSMAAMAPRLETTVCTI